ncbi:hypothetical protein TIFTF001_002611 [Ficus carica]|uniref:(S)-hydroxynitrile lyase n=1 Tax=Ficus carica TaxID=3494 RepID=A0AA88CTS0_FICCA|nr:hypothetical protein TIFTF001_002611 [Ficus carica]
MAAKGEKHFVLLHGACHGAWSWHKLKPLLESAGHRVTVLDLAASGIDTKAIQDVHSMSEYSQPLLELMESLAPNEKVVLAGHSLGGLSLALAMDKFPDKISAAVFVTAFLPDTIHQPSFVIDQSLELAKTLARPGKLFREDLSRAKNFSKDTYGSVPRVYAVCDGDKLMPEYFQRWMIEHSGVSEVIEIRGADHMPMFSKPQELCDSLVKIALKYA